MRQEETLHQRRGVRAEDQMWFLLGRNVLPQVYGLGEPLQTWRETVLSLDEIRHRRPSDSLVTEPFGRNLPSLLQRFRSVAVAPRIQLGLREVKQMSAIGHWQEPILVDFLRGVKRLRRAAEHRVRMD